MWKNASTAFDDQLLLLLYFHDFFQLLFITKSTQLFIPRTLVEIHKQTLTLLW